MTSEADCKREFVYERLQQREDDRQAVLEKKRTEKEQSSVANEKTGYFTEMFSQAKTKVQSKLDNSSRIEKSNLPAHFDSISSELKKLQKFLADSVIFLPSYDVRVSQASIKLFHEQLQAQKDAMLPKKKFAFKARVKESERKAESVTQTDGNIERVISDPTFELCGFQDAFGERLAKAEDELENQNVGLYRLKECDVFLLGCPSTMHMSGLSKCRVFCGPVKTSIFIDNCRDCTFVVACQQLRTHSIKDTDFYLHAASNPIIEDCSHIRFAPYNLSYPMLDKHFITSEVNRELNLWQDVNDFNWLALDVPSPNWTVLPEDERVKFWHLDSHLKPDEVDLPV